MSNPDLVATTLELTPVESQVAVWLAEGKSVRDMAEATTSQSQSMRIAARCCLTVGTEPGWVRM